MTNSFQHPTKKTGWDHVWLVLCMLSFLVGLFAGWAVFS